MRIVFMGTPDFAVGPLEAIIQAGHEVVCVVTQPDKPKGRSAQLVPPPVKECALSHQLPVIQPVKLRTGEYYDMLRDCNADVFVVVAFGQILPKEVLDMPRLGCINIHASLLPKYRGAAPIQWAILNGDEETGVTIQQMNEGVDTGDILSVVKYRIEATDTADSLFDKLCELSGPLVVQTLSGLEKGEIVPTPQNEDECSHVGKISKEYGKIDWQLPATVLDRRVRGLNSWPSAYTYLDGKQLKIWTAKPLEGDAKAASAGSSVAGGTEQTMGSGVTADKDLKPGCIAAIGKDHFDVLTGEGILRVLELQLEGKKRMSAGDFLRGMQLAIGKQLG